MTESKTINAVNFNGMVFMHEADLQKMLDEAAEKGAYNFHQRIMNEKEDKELATDEACAFLGGMKRDTLYGLVSRYKIAYRKGRPNFYRTSELERLKSLLEIG